MFDTPGLKKEVITTIQILKQSDANEVCDFFFFDRRKAWAIPISYRGTHLLETSELDT